MAEQGDHEKAQSEEEEGGGFGDGGLDADGGVVFGDDATGVPGSIDRDGIENNVHKTRIGEAAVEGVEIDAGESEYAGALAASESDSRIAYAVEEAGDERLKGNGAAGQLKFNGRNGVVDDEAIKYNKSETRTDCSGLVLGGSVDDGKRIGLG